MNFVIEAEDEQSLLSLSILIKVSLLSLLQEINTSPVDLN